MAKPHRSGDEEHNLYVPASAEVESSEELSATERLLTVRRLDGCPVSHEPGQFVQVSLFGLGQAPISVCSADGSGGPTFQLCVRRIGRLTQAVHSLAPGDRLGIRGPYGKGFQTERMSGQEVLFIAGGIGMAPLRSLVQHCLAQADRFGPEMGPKSAQNPENRGPTCAQLYQPWSMRCQFLSGSPPDSTGATHACPRPARFLYLAGLCRLHHGCAKGSR